MTAPSDVELAVEDLRVRESQEREQAIAELTQKLFDRGLLVAELGRRLAALREQRSLVMNRLHDAQLALRRRDETIVRLREELRHALRPTHQAAGRAA